MARRVNLARETTRRAAERRHHNLPVQLSSFVGREDDLAEAKCLRGRTRLLTVTGPGGIGKTRLALQLASDVEEEYADGVWLVELAPLADAALVARVVASVLGVREKPGHALIHTLGDALRDRAMLLVLDNCEHLAQASADLAHSLLSRCLAVHILATSREPLGVPGEVAWQVPPLAVPGDGDLQVGTELMRSGAGRLFVERAQAAQPGFRLTDQNGAAVAEVCRRVDGIPLALELAAARVPVLSVEDIAARLDDRFQLLTSGSRVGPLRHHTLGAAVGWSYDLLTAPERGLFDQLSVFARGWSLEAAVAVGGNEPGETSARTLDLLARLVAKSLVVAEPRPNDQVRYRQLETLRQYGEDRLDERGETASVRRQHAQYYLGLAERAERELGGAQAVPWLDRLDADHDNLRSALRWYLQQADAEGALRLGGALWQFWYVRGYLEEGWTWVAQILSLSGADAQTRVRGKVLFGAAMLAYYRGEHAASESLADEGLALSRRLGERAQVARLLTHIGKLARTRFDFSRARSLLDEGLAEARAAGSRVDEAERLVQLGRLDYLGANPDMARFGLEQALAISIELGYGQGIVGALRCLGEVAYQRADYAVARSYLEASVARARGLGDKWRAAWAPVPLGYLLVDQGNDELACSVWTESLVAWRDLGNLNHLAGVVEGFAYQASHHGDHERALRLVAAAAATRRAHSSVILPEAQVWLDRWLHIARAALAESTAATAWSEGEAMSTPEAISYALNAPAWDALQVRRGRSSGVGPLTGRQLEVVELIGRGATDREIARTLVISERTAHAHVRNILTRLSVQSRVQVAAWAAQHGLPMHLENGREQDRQTS